MQKRLELVEVSKGVPGAHITGWALKFDDGQYIGEKKWLLAFFFPWVFLTGVTHVSMSKAHLWLSPKAALRWALSKKFCVHTHMVYYVSVVHFLCGLPYGYFSARIIGTDASKILETISYPMRRNNAPRGQTLYVHFEHDGPNLTLPFRTVIL